MAPNTPTRHEAKIRIKMSWLEENMIRTIGASFCHVRRIRIWGQSDVWIT